MPASDAGRPPPASTRSRGPPDEPPRDEGESGRDHAFRDPKGKERTMKWVSAHSARTSWRPDPASRRKTAADTAATKADRTAGTAPEPVREMPDRKEPVVPRGDRAAEQADPQGRVLDEGARAGDPRSPDAAPDDLEDRQDGHADEQRDRYRVLDAVGERRRGRSPSPPRASRWWGTPAAGEPGGTSARSGGGVNGYRTRPRPMPASFVVIASPCRTPPPA